MRRRTDTKTDAGIDENQLPKRHVEEWQKKRKAQCFSREEPWAMVEALALTVESAIPETVFDEWWHDRLTGDKKKITGKSLRALLAKVYVSKFSVSDEKLNGTLPIRL